MQEPILRMLNISKRFPGVLANDNVNIDIYPGEIHALLGENGAGKSTLMNILTGIYFPTSGEIIIKGHRMEDHNTRTAAEMGIGMVHQHFMLVETLTAAENIFLASGKCPAWINQAKMNEVIRKFSEEINLPVDPSAKIWQLSIGEQQRVEIIKLLFSGTEILILDEPTAVLTPQESDDLFQALRNLADHGKTVVFITHKMNEVIGHADRITVLRNGKSVATLMKNETNRESLMRMMVGHDLPPTIHRDTSIRIEDEPVVLKLNGISALTDRGIEGLHGIDLEVHRGEILGIAGVSGNGQKELAEVITGLRETTGGTITLFGENLTNSSPKECLDKGIAYIPEDRIGVGLVSNMNMDENVILRSFDREPYSRNGMLRKSEIRRKTEELVSSFDIRNAGLNNPIGLMSGGNIQKLLIAREIEMRPKMIVASYPVHGLDIGATQSIHNILTNQRNAGTAILLFSEDIDELFEMSDRIAVLFGGRIMGMDSVENLSYESVGRMMLGSALAEEADR